MKKQIAILSVAAAFLIVRPAGFAAAAVVLKVAPTEFWFTANEGGANPADQILSIWKDGGGTLNWEVTEDCNWIVVEPNSGESTGEVDDVNVIVDVSGLSVGSYNCELTVTGEGAVQSPQTVDVNLVINWPIIELSAGEFEFLAFEGGTNPEDQILGISNSGAGTLNWEVTCDCNWLTADPNIGSSTGEVDDVSLAVDATGLPYGQYNCNLTVSDSNAVNSPQTVDVNLVITGPIIELSAGEFEFLALEGGTNPEDQILGISNSGGGTLNWEVTCDCNWLTADPNIGSSTGEWNDVNLSVDISGLTKGVYDCNLTISDINAVNSPQTVGINLNVYYPEELLVPSEYGTIQEAIDAAFYGDVVIVEPNVYTGSGNKNLNFGGRAITVQSESGPESTIIDCENSGRGFTFNNGEEANSVVSGFTITRGKVVGYGGGIYCTGSSPTIENCIITGCRAHRYTGNPNGGNSYGGGIYCSADSNPIIVRCTISNNNATGGNGTRDYFNPPTFAGDGGRGYGGGIFGSSFTIENCVIVGNTARGGNGGESIWPGDAGQGGSAYGGAVFGSSGATINNCIILGNTARGGDGGYDYDELDRHGCGGSAYGGGIYGSSGTTVNNCTIINNTVTEGNSYQGPDPTVCAVSTEGDGIRGGGTITVTDCILWGNGDDLYGCSATYSCIEDGDAGTGNISADPCFITGPQGDYYLSQIAAGQASDSPCVDAGSDTAANLGMDIFTTRTDQMCDQGVVDMGYHYSMIEYADLDLDFDVDFVDFTILAAQWQQAPSVPSADIAPPGGDGIVDESDVELIAEQWLWGVTFIDLDANLVAHWKFDEGEGTTAYDSVGSNHGIIYGALWTTGQINGALSFDGVDEYVDLGNDNSLDIGTHDASFSFWVYLEDNNFQHVISKYQDDSNFWAIYPRNTGGFTFYGKKSGGNVISIGSDNNIVSLGEWTHIAFTLDRDDVGKLYVNGEFINDGSHTSLMSSVDYDNDANLMFGAQQGSSLFLNGTIDDVRIYDRALSDYAILQLYQQGL